MVPDFLRECPGKGVRVAPDRLKSCQLAEMVCIIVISGDIADATDEDMIRGA